MMNLANAYSDRTPYLAEGDRAQNLEKAIAAYRRALEIFTPDGLPDDCRRAARSLANLHFTGGQYAQVIEPYGLAMRAADQLLRASLARSSKEVELGEIQGLPVKAAYALARLDRLEDAVETLEAGRARLLAEALEANRRDLEQLEPLGHGELLARYRAAAGRLAALQAQGARISESASQRMGESVAQPDFVAWRVTLEAAQQELGAAIAAIRQIPGYEDFFRPPTFAKIRQAIAPPSRSGEGPGVGAEALVYLLATSAGGLALVVRGVTGDKPGFSEKPGLSPVTAIWLDLTEAGLRERVWPGR